jgi:hypothetical protein
MNISDLRFTFSLAQLFARDRRAYRLGVVHPEADIFGTFNIAGASKLGGEAFCAGQAWCRRTHAFGF